MNLYENLCDNIKECETKIGYRKEELNLYYPVTSLYELLDASQGNLSQKIEAFCEEVEDRLGKVSIYETEEAGRYGISVSPEGVEYIHENIEESEFLKIFLKTLKGLDASLDSMEAMFRDYAKKHDTSVVVEAAEEDEVAFYFENPEVDPYVYYVEEGDFGLEYHRFTPAAYQLI